MFFGENKKVELELVISVHADDIFMAYKTETLNNIKEKIKENSTSKST